MPPFREIERRFLLLGFHEETLAGFPWFPLEQHYLAGCAGVRIRREGERYRLTIKGRGLGDRVEVEKDLSEGEYLALLGLCDRGLQKRRYSVGGWVIDIFQGPLAGLVLTETELSSPDEALPPFPIEGVGMIEVTEDPRFTNSQLAWGKIPRLESGEES
jgi:adenylate cyclase